MKLTPEELENKGYTFLDKVGHKDLIPFLAEKNKGKKSVIFYTYFVCLILPIPLISSMLTYYLMTDRMGVWEAILSVLSGIVLVLLFIPFHELLHALGYKLIGSNSISYFANFKKLYFATLADKSVLDVKEFRMVALLPFLFVNTVSLPTLLVVNEFGQVLLLVFVALHNLFCSGDFSLLNFMQRNKNKGIVTFDDKEKGESYFYIRKG